jgi:hypothetical protein
MCFWRLVAKCPSENPPRQKVPFLQNYCVSFSDPRFNTIHYFIVIMCLLMHYNRCKGSYSVNFQRLLFCRAIFKLLECFQWDITSDPPSHGSAEPVMVGLQLDPELAFSVLDRGPIADSVEVTITSYFSEPGR